jgi:hypothetical protein
VVGSNYYLKASDGFFELECLLPSDSSISSQSLDFETNFKAAGNVRPSQYVAVQQEPPFTAKTMLINGVKKNLFARNTGKQFGVTTGSNDLNYTATFAWVKMIGLECIGAEIGDYAELRVYDSPAGTYSGVPNALLNQFGYTLNLAKDYYVRTSPFDSDVYAGMVLKITYNSISDKTIGINYLMNEVKS